MLIAILTSCAPLDYQNLENFHREQSGVHLTLSTLPPQIRVGKNIFRVNLTDASGEPIADATVTFSCRMGHVSFLMPHAEKANIQQPGLYEAEVDLNMGGEWDFTIEVERAGLPTVREEFIVSAGSI
ncbi:MAG TPA: FixH family protein [Nitrospiria bacterium]|nr:FixH family protein [Nitrospiria bacterium]